ncbi:hypothetical protein EYZ11_009580 [Aspergillus tanneri]|uniref:Uncharacterized protein n=1 Tax=Aspergillus tanneri TaxID=1220188 RepID=A0A4S3JCY0_9EURO|nr:hypothetical protein EYZ11_009580 [Aspergillus tanneri]
MANDRTKTIASAIVENGLI